MAYTTSDKVAELLGVANFDISSIPKKTTVETFITRAEDKIDTHTGHAWETRTITNEYISPSSWYRYGTGIRFKLNNRQIKQLETGEGDKIELWDGNNWVDFVATKTEGRNNDYWLNYEEGVVYILGTYKVFPDGLRITYRYGESTVSASIEECATMMAANMVLNSPEFVSATFTDDGGSNRRDDNSRVTYWRETINSILANNTEFKSI